MILLLQLDVCVWLLSWWVEMSRVESMEAAVWPAQLEAVHELELPGPLGPGFAKDPTRAASYAALAAAGAFASGVLSG